MGGAVSADPRTPAILRADPPAPPLVRVEDLAITHDGATRPTPASVSFVLHPGEVVLVLGPSGSGKSTLTLALNGLIPHALPAEVSGTVEVAGVDTRGTSVARLSEHVGMVFQDPDAQLVTGTVLDEVAFGLENLRVPAPEIMRRVQAALTRVGLWERRGDNPDRLSGGGRQRLAIACALAMGSPVLVLDEPTANLDAAGIEDVYAALRDLVATGDRAVVLVEHNLDAAIGFVDRVLVLDAAGNLVLDGPAAATLRARADELHDMGVWLPTSLLAARRLRDAGYALDPLPLSPAALHAALERTPVPHARQSPASATPIDSADAGTSGADATHRADGSSEPLIRVRGLTVLRDQVAVLHGIDLDVGRGDFLAVVGANGAGKTTLVQAIAGVVPPPRGRVRVGDLDSGRADARALSRTIGFVFQNPEHQFVTNTVFDELAHGLRLRRTPESEIRERVRDVLERFGLADRADVHPFLLSGGQKRRLSVGTALITGASVIALDEPTFGQDRARAEELMSLLDDLHAEGATVIVVTHDMQLVAEHATHTAVLSAGRLLTVGPTSDVLADGQLLESAGLRMPPLRAALTGLLGHPELDGAVRLADLPGRRG